VVFIIGMEEGVFPHMRALEEGGEEESAASPMSHHPHPQAPLSDPGAERRIFGGRREPAIASRFIDELPAELVEEQRSSPRAGAPWAAVGGRPRSHRSSHARRWSCRPATTSCMPAFGAPW